jgi:hypothetical protein
MKEDKKIEEYLLAMEQNIERALWYHEQYDRKDIVDAFLNNVYALLLELLKKGKGDE